MTQLTQQSYDWGQQILATRSSQHLKQHEQYLTPPRLAAFAAQQLGPLPDSLYLLDPALGSGTLVAAVIDRLIAEGKPRYLMIEGYEPDPLLYNSAGDMLLRADNLAATAGIVIEWSIHAADFIDAGVRHLQPTLFAPHPPRYSHIIANPLPPLASILRMGETLERDPAADLDALVMQVLVKDGQLAADFPALHEIGLV